MVYESGFIIRGDQTSSAALGTKFDGDAWTTTKRAEKKDRREKRLKCMVAVDYGGGVESWLERCSSFNVSLIQGGAAA